MINNGFTPDKEDYELCTKVDNMIIPTEGFFGISAATGGLAGIVLFSVLKKPLSCELKEIGHIFFHIIPKSAGFKISHFLN